MRLRITLVLSVMLLLTVFTLSGCGTKANKKTPSTKPLTAKNIDIEIKDFAFEPGSATVAVRSRVTWTNKDPGTHTIDSDGFSSGPLGQGESYSFQFMKAGTYPYRCGLHPYMEGTIIVK